MSQSSDYRLRAVAGELLKGKYCLPCGAAAGVRSAIPCLPPLTEHVRSRLCNTWLPQLWRQLSPDMVRAVQLSDCCDDNVLGIVPPHQTPAETVDAFKNGLGRLQITLSPVEVEEEIKRCYPSVLISK